MSGAGGGRLRTLTWSPPGEFLGRVLLVHGLGEHSGRYGHVATHLSARGFGVMAFDLRGHGKSEGRRGVLDSFDLLVEDVQRAREVAERTLPGESDAFLYGHSLGALGVLRYLQTDRPATPGVVLSAPWLATAWEFPTWLRLGARVLLRVLPDLPLANPRSDPRVLTADPEAQEAFRRDPLMHHKLSARFFDEVERAQVQALAGDRDPAIPMMVLVPMEDGLVDAETTLRWCASVQQRGLTVERLEGTRHEPHNDSSREAVLGLVTSWLVGRAT